MDPSPCSHILGVVTLMQTLLYFPIPDFEVSSDEAKDPVSFGNRESCWGCWSA